MKQRALKAASKRSFPEDGDARVEVRLLSRGKRFGWHPGGKLARVPGLPIFLVKLQQQLQCNCKHSSSYLATNRGPHSTCPRAPRARQPSARAMSGTNESNVSFGASYSIGIRKCSNSSRRRNGGFAKPERVTCEPRMVGTTGSSEMKSVQQYIRSADLGNGNEPIRVRF